MTQSAFDFNATAATVPQNLAELKQSNDASPCEYKAAMLLEHSAEANGRSFEQCLAAVRNDKNAS
ncbi:hypothetical protein [uncultured Limnobacter sp.]|uniref:hypothetical protein n=1 Tax=uncultured Limnobacter sp. TaxID=199681 RepID=UPI0032B16B07